IAIGRRIDAPPSHRHDGSMSVGLVERTTTSANAWPELPLLSDWVDTFTTLHMWTQIVGKIRLELGPWTNHSWGVALYVTSRGLTTSPLAHGTRTFSIDFDFIDHALRIATGEGDSRSFPLRLMSVAEFYAMTMDALRELDLEVRIYTRPVEVVEAI